MLALCFSASKFNSQITIGSDLAPNAGALLDFKNNPNGFSNKGLGLPRVELIDPWKLIMGKNSNEILDKESHTGLLVYNTTINNDLCPGLYVWEGMSWQPIQNDSPEILPTVMDGDGNHYPYKAFGSKLWMTKNLRTTKKADGTPLSDPLVKINPGFYNSTPMEVFGFANKNEITTTPTPKVTYEENTIQISDSYDSFVNKFGLLYKIDQAIEACPTGWRLPTVDDWKELSQTVDPTTPGIYLKGNNFSYKSNDDAFHRSWGGEPYCSTKNKRFGALPTGLIIFDEYANNYMHVSFGEQSFYWATENIENISLALLNSDQNNLEILDMGPPNTSLLSSYLSVRCIKDK